MFVYFIPLTGNLTKNSILEKFGHELNALWELSGSSLGALRELVAVAGIIEDQQDKLIQHTEDRNKLLIQIEEDWQESNRFFMTWQLSSILQVAHTYTISLAGYGMKNVVMGVGTFIC